MKKLFKKVAGWGAYPSVRAKVWKPASVKEVQELVHQKSALIARGSGYSYGDSSLQRTIISTKNLNNIIAEGEDWIEVQTGITLDGVLQYIIPKRKFLAVTPGTKQVTIGGAIASDVHGKNHRKAGSFFNITESLKVVNEAGKILDCSRQKNAGLFYSCFGGMGLQGIIISAVVRLMPLPSYMITEQQFIANSLTEIFALMQQHQDASYLVGWIDLLGKQTRGIVKTGEWNEAAKQMPKKKRTLTIPFTFPLAPPRFLFTWYNKRYLTKAQKHTRHIISFDQFFYPLDSIKNWRYVFGKNGLLQYHFVLPLHVSEMGIKEVIALVKNSGAVCTLAVLKLFGRENTETPQAFTREGYNLALDFIHTPKAVELIHQLDKKIHALGGQIYKAKDAVSHLPIAIKSSKFQSMQNQRYEHK